MIGTDLSEPGYRHRAAQPTLRARGWRHSPCYRHRFAGGSRSPRRRQSAPATAASANHRRECAKPALAEHSRVRLGFRRRTGVVCGYQERSPADMIMNPARDARRILLVGISTLEVFSLFRVGLASENLGWVHLGHFLGGALLGHQLRRFDKGRSFDRPFHRSLHRGGDGLALRIR